MKLIKTIEERIMHSCNIFLLMSYVIIYILHTFFTTVPTIYHLKIIIVIIIISIRQSISRKETFFLQMFILDNHLPHMTLKEKHIID